MKTPKRQKINDEKDPTAPIVGGEFVTQEGDWRGQTVEVKADTKLEADTGVGEAIIWRFYEFAANPQVFHDYEKANGRMPFAQEIFQSHAKGILALLWQDGLRPAEEFPPRLIISKKKDRYLIHVAARPQLGQTILEKTKTLTEIANDPAGNTDKVSRKLQLPTAKKKKTSRAA